ncbi:ACC2 [Symbiodinium sp. KB8]|nr:ACC2 [Symbiodinium sp. KB8]
MGSGGSCAKSTGPGSCDIPKDWPVPEKRTGPDLFTHQLYVEELDTYLRKVAKKPEVFQKKVELRRETRCREPADIEHYDDTPSFSHIAAS